MSIQGFTCEKVFFRNSLPKDVSSEVQAIAHLFMDFLFVSYLFRWVIDVSSTAEIIEFSKLLQKYSSILLQIFSCKNSPCTHLFYLIFFIIHWIFLSPRLISRNKSKQQFCWKVYFFIRAAISVRCWDGHNETMYRQENFIANWNSVFDGSYDMCSRRRWMRYKIR